MISAQFLFKPGTYDDEFHRLDAEIEAYVATIPGFLGAEKWVSFDGTTKNSRPWMPCLSYPAMTEVQV